MTRQNWALIDPKLIAILRGVQPSQIEGIVDVLLEVGFKAIEIPLNSPDPIRSIDLAVKRVEQQQVPGCLIGAGTVLSVEQVMQVQGVGGELIVSPNVNPDVIRKAVDLGMVSLPGVFTPTEALLALDSGASGLKFFPASLLGADGIKAIKAILPVDASICAVGGVSAKNFAAFAGVGVEGFGLGSDLYKPGISANDVKTNAQLALEAFRKI